MNSVNGLLEFNKQVADLALRRGLSKADTICALLIASGHAKTWKIPATLRERCLTELAIVPPDVAKSAAFNNLCKCAPKTHYDVDREEEAEKHLKRCKYVRWRSLIGDPLPSVFF